MPAPPVSLSLMIDGCRYFAILDSSQEGFSPETIQFNGQITKVILYKRTQEVRLTNGVYSNFTAYTGVRMGSEVASLSIACTGTFLF